MAYQLRLNNPKLDDAALACGTIICDTNRIATAKEIEYLLEEVVNRCADLVSRHYSPIQIRKHFNVN